MHSHIDQVLMLCAVLPGYADEDVELVLVAQRLEHSVSLGAPLTIVQLNSRQY